ncbi:HET-domain-containing protein, partial [Lojkania enalia]
MTAPFVYQPLAGSETRLFSIEPGKVDDPLRVQLRHIRLETTPTYHALSYVWGDSNDKVQISVNDVPFSIPRNLYNALGQLREILIAKKEEGFLFWADSISINQQDEAEKSREVLRMGEIYQSAYQVTGWLGMAED